MHFAKTPIAIAAATAAGAHLASVAQTAATEAAGLPAITVTSTRTERRVDEVPNTVTVKSACEVEQAGARDIQGVCRDELDVTVRQQAKLFPDTQYTLAGAVVQDEIEWGAVSIIPGLRDHRFKPSADPAGCTGTVVSLSDSAVTPRLVRVMGGRDQRRVLPLAMGAGALLLGADTVARTVAIPAEVPVGIFTALIGALVCLAVLRGAGRHQGGAA
jgi:FecCD transport family